MSKALVGSVVLRALLNMRKVPGSDAGFGLKYSHRTILITSEASKIVPITN